MLHSKAYRIDVYELAETVVEAYRDCLRSNMDRVLLAPTNQDESAIELVCKIKPPRHISRREADSLKRRIHVLLPMCLHVWVQQDNKNGHRSAEVVADLDPAFVHLV